MPVTYQFVFDGTTLSDFANFMELFANYQRLSEMSQESKKWQILSKLLYAQAVRLGIRFYAEDASEVPVEQVQAFATAFIQALGMYLAHSQLPDQEYNGLFRFSGEGPIQ